MSRMQVFERLPVRVVWKRNERRVTAKFFTAPWFQQQDLLASGAVAVFVSQLGMVR